MEDFLDDVCISLGVCVSVLRFLATSHEVVRRTMFEMAPKRSESNFGWQPFFSSSWQTFYSKTLQFYYVKLTSHNFWINADKRKIF